MQRLGQHFLTSAAIAKRIVDAANILPADTILEVGPGTGMLTQFLVTKAKKVIAVEKDKNLVVFLREKFGAMKNLEVVEGDILQIQNSKFKVKNYNAKFKIPKKYKIAANIPYYITSKLLRLFLEEIKNKPQSMTLMVQKEVAERICATPPRMNLLALSVQAFGTPKILFKVGKGNFSPPPEVDSAVIAIKNISDNFFKKYHISPQEFFKLPQKAFSQKRKMLRHSIPDVGHPEFATKRPQELFLEDWVMLLKKKTSSRLKI